MRRPTVVVTALALVFGASCRDDGGERGAAVTFVGWGAPEERAFVEEAVDAFRRREPDIRVHYEQVPGVGYDYLNKLRLMIVAGQAPDVFYVPDGAFAELVSAGALRDLATNIASSDLDLGAMWPTAVDRYRWDGGIYALPKDLGPMALYWNVDTFRRLGVAPPSAEKPMTWDEAIAMWHKLTFEERSIQHYGLTQFPYEAAVWSSGGEVLSADHRSWGLVDPVAERAVQWCADLALEEHVAPSPARVQPSAELFEAGIAATHVDGRWMVPRFRQLPFDWDVAPIPVPGRGVPLVSRSGSVGFAVSAKARHPREAFALVRFLAGSEGQAILVRSGLQLPNQRADANSESFLQRDRRPAHAEVFISAAETSRPAPQTKTASAFWYDAQTALADPVWRGERTAADLFPEIAPRIDEALRAGERR